MNSRTLLIIVALVALVVGTDAVRRHRPAAAPPPPPEAQASGSHTVVGSTVVTEHRLGPVPGIADQNPGTPTLDLMARLAVRRRIEREGSRVYLDSLLANTDSIVVRWADRGDTPLSVGFVLDSTLPGWNNALLDDVRSAMQAWDGNSAGLRFREASNPDSADVRVHWVTALPDTVRVGLTNLTWDTEGAVRNADVTLALQEGLKHTALPSSVRRRVAMHELGHAMGLPHSADRDDLMFPGTLTGTPSRRDQATLQLLYAVPPGSLHVPR